MEKIVKATSRGQITLPVNWRKQFSTDQFLLNTSNNKLIIEPVELSNKQNHDLSLKQIINEEKKKSDIIIFDAYRDNNGEGIEAEKFLKILKKVNGQD